MRITFLFLNFLVTTTLALDIESLNHLYETIYQNNHSLLKDRSDIKGHHAYIYGLKTIPNPTFSYSYNLQEIETRVGPQIQKFSLQQKIPWPSKLSTNQKSHTHLSAAHHQMQEANWLNIKKEAGLIWATLFLSEQEARVTNQMLDVLKTWKVNLKTSYEAGLHPYTDLLKINTAIDLINDKHRYLSEYIQLQKDLLRELCGISTPLQIDPIKQLDINFEFISKDSLFGKIGVHPTLKALDLKTKASQQKVELARQNYIPDLSLGVSYIQTGDRPNVSDSGKDPLTVSASIDLPIYWKKIKSEIQKNEHETTGFRHQIQHQETRLRRFIENHYFHYKNSKAQIELYTTSLIPNLEQTIGVLKTNYQAGKARFADLMDSYKVLLELQIKKLEAETQLFKARVNLEWIDPSSSFIVRNQ